MFRKLRNLLSGNDRKTSESGPGQPPPSAFQKPANAFAEPQAQKSLGLDSNPDVTLDLPKKSNASSQSGGLSTAGSSKKNFFSFGKQSKNKTKKQGSGQLDIPTQKTSSQELPSPPKPPKPAQLIQDPTDSDAIHKIPLQKKPDEKVSPSNGPPASPWEVDTPPINEPPITAPSETDEGTNSGPGELKTQHSEAGIKSGPEMIPFPPHLGRAFVIGIKNQKTQEFSQEAEEKAATEMEKEVDIADDRIALKDVHLLTDNNEPIVLGEGGFGKVYKGSLYKEICAVKTVNQGTRKEQARFLNEIKILGRLKTKHITRFMGFAVLPDGLCLIMEYVPGGTLYKSLQTSDRHKYYNKGRDVLMSVAIALNVLHSKRIAHLDIKSPNVLIDERGDAKVADVGLSKLMKGEMSLVSMPGSWPWSAPEQLNGQAGITCDIWSWGTLAFEVCTGEKPPMNRYLRPIKVPDEAPQQLVDLMKKCHVPNTSERIDADSLYHLLEQCPATRPE